MKTSAEIDQLAAALSCARGMMPAAKKSGKSHHGFYSTLADIWEVAKDPLSQNGLAVVQAPSFFEGRIVIMTRLIHKSGQWLETELPIKPIRDDAQSAGSAITYGRRYSLGPILGIVDQEDDDGNAATSSKPHQDEDGPKMTQSTIRPKEDSLLPASPKFDKDDIKALAWLEKKLIERNISMLSLKKIAEVYHGKTLTAESLDQAIHAALFLHHDPPNLI